MALTDTTCRNAKGRERPYKMADGEGLYLFVQPSGSKLWRMAYRFEGKQKTLAFGVYPHVTLADARDKRAKAKKALADGNNPAVTVEDKAETFESVARRWYDNEKDSWADSHSGRLFSRLERDGFSEIGALPINAIKPPVILEMLRKVEGRGAIEVAKRLKQSVSSVFKFAIAEGLIEHNPAANVGAALKPTPKTRHFATIKPAEAPELVQKIDAYQGEPITRLALLFTLHTFVRTNEVRFGKWYEIEGDIWRIPKERMKMGKEHIVPLTTQTLALLEEAKAHQDGPYLFPRERGKPMSENRMIYALYRMGYHSRLTVHGFRRLASTTLNEAGFNSDWVEMQLAHVPQDRIRGIYNSAEWLAGRREMMTWWSACLSSAIHSAKVDSRQRTDWPPIPTGLGNSPSAILR